MFLLVPFTFFSPCLLVLVRLLLFKMYVKIILGCRILNVPPPYPEDYILKDSKAVSGKTEFLVESEVYCNVSVLVTFIKLKLFILFFY